MVQNYVIVLVCCSSYIMWHWISHSADLYLNFLLKLEIIFFIKTDKQPLLHFLNKSWPINPTTGELFSLIFSFLDSDLQRWSLLIVFQPKKCIFKYWSNFHSLCIQSYFCRWAGTITAVSVAGAGLALHQGTSESVRARGQAFGNEQFNKESSWWLSEAFVRKCFRKVCSVMGELSCFLWRLSWQCSVPYLQSFLGLISDSGWLFLNPVQNNCVSFQSLAKRWSIKCITFQTHFPFYLSLVYILSK